MLLQTRRLRVRSIRPEDEKAFIHMASDGSLTEIFGDCRECHKWMGDFIEEAIRLEKEDNPGQDYMAFAIEEKESGRVVGSVGSSYYEDFAEVGVTYFIGAQDRGKGYAAEALGVLVEHLFERYELRTLVATARVDNVASCRTLEKTGFLVTETKMYQDLYDEEETLSNIYRLERG